jgi:uncharacterized membrane protein YphA (DoxX/SURF4 family)
MPGLGLLILRTATGVATGVYGAIVLSRLETVGSSRVSFTGHVILSLILITGSIFFILGLLMPFISITVAVCELFAAVIRTNLSNPLQGSRFGWIALLLLASIAVALAFLGPGAFSIDARLFGRRQIIIPASKQRGKSLLKQSDESR